MVDGARLARRGFVGTLVAGAAAGRSEAAGLPDGHAAGLDAARSADGVRLLPRKPGDAPVFTFALDRAALKATSGGWAREVTTRQLPIATGIALAHLFLNPGGAREMHWHDCGEWAYVMAGRAQATVADPDGTVETFDVGPGDLWFFPRGYPHAIQTIGTEPCHALLAFDDGLYSEHGTFGISDLMSRLDPAVLAQSLGIGPDVLAVLPRGETYIMQGEVIDAAGRAAGAVTPRTAARSRRFRMEAARPVFAAAGGTIHLVTAAEFPASAPISGALIRLMPGAVQPVHWHPDGNEMHYVMAGQVEFTLYGPDKHLAVAEIGAGTCAYVPRNAAHLLRNTGAVPAAVIAVQDTGRPVTATLADWLAHAPTHLLANNLGLDGTRRPVFRRGQPIVAATG